MPNPPDCPPEAAPGAPPEAAPAPICPPKRRQILAGARSAFNEMGFERASVDLIAARAGVSKATLYNYFADKKALFVACFAEEADALREGMRRALLDEPAGELEPALQILGELLLRLLITPDVLSFYRHTTAEAARFPGIGELLFDRGPAVLYAALAAWLERWQERGALRVDDARAAAVQFAMLCHGEIVLRAQLGIETSPSDAAIRATVAGAVRVFLRAYGTCPPGHAPGASDHERAPK